MNAGKLVRIEQKFFSVLITLHHKICLLHTGSPGWRGGATVGRRTSGREAVGSIPGRGVAA